MTSVLSLSDVLPFSVIIIGPSSSSGPTSDSASSLTSAGMCV